MDIMILPMPEDFPERPQTVCDYEPSKQKYEYEGPPLVLDNGRVELST